MTEPESAPPTFDFSNWPLVIANFPAVASIEYADFYMQTLEANAYQRGRFVLLADLSNLIPRTATSTVRAHFSKLGNDVEARYPDSLVGEVVVSPNPVVRGILQAYLWFKESERYETVIVSDYESAHKWCEALIKDRMLGK